MTIPAATLRRLGLCALLAAASGAAGFGVATALRPSPPPREVGSDARPWDADAPTREFLARNEARYARSVDRAIAWLDRLDVDPTRLREAGLKGKKKLVEALDTYARLHSVAPEAERPRILERIRSLVQVTYTPEYHDMSAVDDRQFKQDATSYLRAAVVMDRLGLDTARYRQEIRRIQPRLDAHMAQRGPHQQMVFHWYYRHFGMPEPFDLASGYQVGVIRSRRDPYAFRAAADVYDLTHEVFVPYQFGDRLDAGFFDPDESRYLERTLDVLTTRYLFERNPDLVAELVCCIRYLGFTHLPVYREALTYLLDAQQADGKWGDYERFRKRYGHFVEAGWYLHTTSVALDALTAAFRFRDEAGGAPDGDEREPAEGAEGLSTTAQGVTRPDEARSPVGVESS